MMAIVERGKQPNYPPFVWAKDISVAVYGPEIELSGILPVIEEDYRAAPDPLRAYRRAINRYGGEKRQGKNSPHVQFANANDVAKQIAFLQRYGPVVSCSSQTEERTVRSQGPYDFGLTETVITARQDISELQSEQSVYRSAWLLIAELRRGKEPDVAKVRECISTIVNNVSAWPSQWERERRMRANGFWYALEPHWMFSEENLQHMQFWLVKAMAKPSGSPSDTLFGFNPIHDGLSVISEIVNAFTPRVYPWGDTPVEAPHWDVAAGIRPLLYYMLRREHLSAAGVGICRNFDCRDIFEIERSGQEFCGTECSRLQRQREYWSVQGKKLRKRRKRQSGSNTKRLSGRKEK